jgi:dCMP deaminase
MPRLSHDHYFMTMAKVASLRSTCKSRQVGSVLVDSNNYVLSTGYNGPAKGLNMCDPCKRADSGSGLNLDACMAIHSEMNALIQCPDIRRIDTIYVTISPCFTCLKLLLNTPCKRIVFINSYPHPESERIWKETGRAWDQLHFPTRARGILESLTKISEYLSLSACFYYTFYTLWSVA